LTPEQEIKQEVWVAALRLLAARTTKIFNDGRRYTNLTDPEIAIRMLEQSLIRDENER
jgi:hypothetical protein